MIQYIYLKNWKSCSDQIYSGGGRAYHQRVGKAYFQEEYSGSIELFFAIIVITKIIVVIVIQIITIVI